MAEHKPNLFTPIALGVVLALVGGGIAAYYYWQKRELPSKGIMGNARLVPKNAIMGASLSTDLKDWQALARFQNTEVKDLLEENTKELFADVNIDPVKDLQPWVGTTFFAILPTAAPQATQGTRYLPVQTTPTPSPPSSTPSPFVLVIEVKNRSKADQFFTNKVVPKLTQPQTATDYKGISIAAAPEFSRAFVGDYLVIALQKTAVEQAIDTFQGQTSFAQSLPSLQLEMKKPLIQVYVPDVASSINYMATFSPNQLLSLDSQPILKRFQNQAMVMGIGVEPTGLRFQSVFSLDKQAPQLQPAPGNILSHFPDQTYALLTGYNFKGAWEEILTQAKTDPKQQEAIDDLREWFKQNLQMDLDKDLLAWMDGEAAMGIIASQEGVLQQAKSGMALSFQTSDRKAAEAALTKVDNLSELLPRELGIEIKSREVEGVTLKEWTSTAAPGPLLGHGWQKPDTLLIAMGPLAEVMAKKPPKPLKESTAFQTIAGSLEPKNQGYLYLNWEKFWEIYSPGLLGSPQVPEEDKKRATGVFTTIRGLGVTYSQPAGLSQVEVEAFLALAPQGKK